ncbi:hypothetical protein MDA_GLEAN10022857 [Myotis davidii]|uniref:Uncharacterized protein n=1 Tax=Myotis davidii TaxID=225400 RepID=L5M1K4_MYODS|nr:hypothetical protein MDA_GLEAN10022857 [Myotis davidii]
MREKHRSAASSTSPIGDVPATQVHALDRNRTRDLSVRSVTLCPLSQTGFRWYRSLVSGKREDVEVKEPLGPTCPAAAEP